MMLGAFLVAGLSGLGVARAADAQKPMATDKPVKITAADAAGPVFHGKSAVKLNDPGDGPVTNVLLLQSKDTQFEAGLYEAGPSDQPIDSYPDDEFMFVLAGSIKLTSADGSVIEAKAGESISMPKGWKGRWTTPGYKKYYVTYTHK